MYWRNKTRFCFIFIIIILLALDVTYVAGQTTYSWNGGVGNWNDDSQWTPRGVPAGGDVAHISSGTVNLSTDAQIKELEFSGGRFTGNGGLVVVDKMIWKGGTIDIGTGVFTIGVGAEIIFTGTSNVMTLNREMIIGGIAHWTSGLISLSGNNGKITNEGTFEVLTGEKIWDNSRFFINNGILIINPDIGFVDWQVDLVNNDSIKIISGTLRLGAPLTGPGAIKLEGNSVIHFFSHDHSFDNNDIFGEGTILMEGNTNVNISGNGIVLPAGITLDLRSGNIQGDGPLHIHGEFLWSGGQIHSTDTITLHSGSHTLVNSSGTVTLNSVLNNYSVLEWTSGIFNSSHSRARVINTGTFSIYTDESIYPYFINNGILQKISGSGTTIFGNFLENNNQIKLLSGTLSLQNGSSGSGSIFIKAGSVYQLFSGNHSFNGNLLTGTGTLELGGGGSKSLVLEGSGLTIPQRLTFRLSSGSIDGDAPLIINGNFIWEGGTIQMANEPVIVNPQASFLISSQGSKTLDRTLINKTNGLWTGGQISTSASTGLFDNHGTFEIQNDSKLGNFINNNVLIKKGTIGTTEINGSFTNNGEVQIATGTIWPSRAAENSATGRISGNGTLMITGSGMTNNGTFSPGTSPGLLTNDGNYTMTPTASLDIEIGGYTPALEYDQLVITGSAFLDGTLNVELVSGFIPSIGDSFTVITYTNRTGEFAQINLPSGLTGHVVYQTDKAVLIIDNIDNGAPNSVGDTVSTPEDTPVSINVLANDYDVNLNPISIQSFTQPSQGTVTQSGDSILTYTPANNFSGIDSFRYTITDNTHGTDEAVVVVTVHSENDPPGIFSLISPGDQAIIDYLEKPVQFRWNKSIDPDGDLLIYRIQLTGTNLDTTIYPVTDTILAFDGSDIFQPGQTYQWFAEAIDGTDTIRSSVYSFTIAAVLDLDDPEGDVPANYELFQNFPNPFNPSTTIRFNLPEKQMVNLYIFNIAGQLVKRLIQGETLNAGVHLIQFRSDDLPTGIYFYQIRTENFIQTKKMVLIK